MEQEEVIEISASARNLLGEEHARSRAAFTSNPPQSHTDPGMFTSAMGEADLPSMRLKFPFLNDYPDNFVRTTPFSVILKAESTQIKLKDMETSRRSEVQLSHNRESLTSTFHQVTSGQDNRWDVLHTARFLPGATCSSSKLWLAARAAMGIKGHAAVATYDMACAGLGGCVTPKAWQEIHNPGSTDMSLKLFTMNNCGNKTAGYKSDSSKRVDEWEEIVEIGDFKQAIRCLRTAMSMVFPWNHSIMAIEGFLYQTNFCHTDLSGLPNQAKLLTQFVDYVLGENANKWRGQESFLSAADLRNTWSAFLGTKPESTLAKIKPKTGYQGNSPWPQRFPSTAGTANTQLPTTGVNQFSIPPPPLNKRINVWNDDICVLWNMGRCVKPPGSCMTKKGIPLRHVCNFRPDLTNPMTVCGVNHPCFRNH